MNRIETQLDRIAQSDSKIIKSIIKKDDASKKFQVHIPLIVLSIFISILTSFISQTVLIHLIPVLPALPSIAQEVFDRIFKL